MAHLLAGALGLINASVILRASQTRSARSNDMGSDQSTVYQEQQNARTEAERRRYELELERLRYEREQQLQEELRLEREKNRRRLEREEKLREQLRLEREKNRRVEHDDFALNMTLEEQQLEEALRRSIIETQMYPNQNSAAGSSRHETHQNTAASNSTENQSGHITLLMDPPRRVVNPLVNNPPETRPRPPFSRTSTTHESGTGTGAAPQASTIRASAPQANTVPAARSAPRTATVGAAVTAPQATTVHVAVTAPQATTVRAAVRAPQVPTARAAGAAPYANTVPNLETPFHAAIARVAGTMPQEATVSASVTAPHSATNRASAAASTPQDNKVFIRENDSTLCKTCKKPYGEKIFQCKNGHSSCESCWTLDIPCGVCRGPITMTRNFDLENYFVANQQIKCPNASEGCILRFKKSDIPKHERVCPFKELKCPALAHCNWKGKISQLSVHFDEEHPISRQANVDTEMYLPITCYEYNSLQLIKLGNFNFLFYIKVSKMERRVYMDIQLIGTKAAALKWYYEIHVYNKKEPCRKYLYRNVCSSFQEITNDISLRNCAILPLSYAMGFINDDTMAYKVYIMNSEVKSRRRYGKTFRTPGTSHNQSEPV